MHQAILVTLAALALVAIPAQAETRDPFLSPQPRLIGSLSFCGATEGFRLSGDRATSLAVEGKLRLQNALGVLSLNAECLHFLDDEAFFKDKSCARFGADVPLGRDAMLFITHERRYRANDDFTLCGIRLKFGSTSD
jgi:hypothetical protein